VGPCHHVIALPRAVDGGLAFSVEGSCEYTCIVSSRGQMIKSGPPAWGLGMGLTTLHCKKINLLLKVRQPLPRTDSLDKRAR
jgi:hypothetical protein